MNSEAVKQLQEEYFFLQDLNIEIGEGWYSILKDLCGQLLEFVPTNFKITQVKEKFGGLRVYYELDDYYHLDIDYTAKISYHNIREKVNACIFNTETLSYEICEICGDPASLDRSKFWMKTLCEFHKLERNI